MRDLLALSALPAILQSYDPYQMADSIAAALVSMLDSEFVYISLHGTRDGPLIEIARADGRSAADSLEAIRAVLPEILPTLSSDRQLAVANPVGGGTASIAVAPIGLGGDSAIVVGSQRPDFPTPNERLLLGIAANEATVALQRWQAETEERTRQTEEELQLVIDTIPALVWSALPDGSVNFVNKRLIEYTGLPLEEVKGWGWTVSWHPADRATLLEKWRTALGAGNPFTLEARVRRADGEYRWFLCSTVPRHDDLGNIVTWYGTITDVEDRKRAEEAEKALHQAQADLAHLTRVSTLGELTSSIAHEVNQPLAAVVANANAALRWLGTQPPNLEEAQAALGRISRDGSRAGDVIRRIRALVKKAPPRKDRLDINEIIIDVIALTRSEVLRNGVSLETRLGRDLPPIRGDRVQLQQVILNFIINAIEAMSEVTERPRELAIDSGKDASTGVLVTVRDSGPGLEPESFDHLFDAFYTTKPGGMGMGLSICRSIIEAHGGQVQAANVPQGAVFQFSVPTAAS
ncbi:sensor histidine kinase [Rhizobium sp. P32RR-XVIII]|uniref:sensor histidine kinase n=1 Tax=Rhizobium sp. P32RR-XVIII TaxID=2726738 RepID=UPI00197FCFC1|nr:ATP-binding protein [Rhizobium sp. P32RR-XVIII]